jgi:hypothetical protein
VDSGLSKEGFLLADELRQYEKDPCPDESLRLMALLQIVQTCRHPY